MSFPPGTNSLEDVDKRYVNGTAWRLFEKWTLIQGRESLIKKLLRRSASASAENKENKKVEEKEIELGDAEEKEILPSNRDLAEVKADGDAAGRGAV